MHVIWYLVPTCLCGLASVSEFPPQTKKQELKLIKDGVQHICVEHAYYTAVVGAKKQNYSSQP